MRNKGLNQVPAGFFKSFGSAEMGCVSLNERGIQVVVPDQKAELVAEPRLAIFMPVAAGIKGLRLTRLGRFGGLWGPTELLDRAEADSVCLTESAVNGAGFGYPHLGAADERRCVRGISISIADKAFRARSLIDDRFKNPTIESWIAAMIYQSGSYSSASSAAGYPQQTSVRDVPAAIKQLEVSRSDREPIVFCELLKSFPSED